MRPLERFQIARMPGPQARIDALERYARKVEEASHLTDPATVARLTGSKTYDPGSLALAAYETTTVTVAGAALGDVAFASFSIALAGVRLTAEVTADDTVTVCFYNERGTNPLNLASGTLAVKIFR